jgi:hypothetical protein
MCTEEAAYVSSGFFYETVAPLLCIGNTSFIAISTLTSEMNFYTKLISKVDLLTNKPVFKSIQISLACQQCIDAEKTHECLHMQHLIPRWQVCFFFTTSIYQVVSLGVANMVDQTRRMLTSIADLRLS